MHLSIDDSGRERPAQGIVRYVQPLELSEGLPDIGQRAGEGVVVDLQIGALGPIANEVDRSTKGVVLESKVLHLAEGGEAGRDIAVQLVLIYTKSDQVHEVGKGGRQSARELITRHLQPFSRIQQFANIDK